MPSLEQRIERLNERRALVELSKALPITLSQYRVLIKAESDAALKMLRASGIPAPDTQAMHDEAMQKDQE